VRSHAKALSVATGLLILLGGIWATSALAGHIHTFSSSFGSAGSGSGQLSANKGIAVDPSDGSLYVVDSGNYRVEKFTAAGSFLLTFGKGVNQTTSANVCTAASGDTCGAGTQGSGGSGFDTNNGFTNPTFAAVDPVSGDVYVADSGTKVIDKFSSSGAFLSSNDGSGSGATFFGTIAGIAVDSSRHLWVYDTGSQMREFDSTGAFLTQWYSGYGVSPVGIAVDSASNLYVLRGEPAVHKFSAAGSDFGDIDAPQATTSMAIDPATDDLYITTPTGVKRFTAGCVAPCSPLETFGASDITSAAGIAVRGSDGTVYVSDPGKPAVDVFDAIPVPTVAPTDAIGIQKTAATLTGTVNPEGPPLTDCHFEYGTTTAYGQTAPCEPAFGSIPADSANHPVSAVIGGLSQGTVYHFRLVAANANGSANSTDRALTTLGPLVHGQSFSEVSDTTVKLQALLNPNGQDTTYHFEYVTQADFEASSYANAKSIPAPAVSIGAGTADVSVSQQPTGLAPSTTYHFRVLASNASGDIAGSDQTFKTYPLTPSFGPCVNDVFRSGGPSARLPDCRAYEQASPVDKNGSDVNGAVERVQASTSGDAVTYFAASGLPGAAGAQDFEMYLSRREGSSWSTSGVYPPAADASVVRNSGWTPDLSQFYSLAGAAFEGHRILRMRSSADRSFTPMATVSQGTNIIVDGTSVDGSKAFFGARVPLIPDPGSAPEPEMFNLYVWDRDTGVVSLAGILPDSDCGSPPCIPQFGSFAGAFSWFESTGFGRRTVGGAAAGLYTEDQHAISDSGEEAFFSAGGTGQLYLRKHAADPGASTVHVSASQRGTPDPEGTKPVEFMRATPSGSVAFFLSCEKLTDDSTAYSPSPNRCDPEEIGIEGSDLYAYDTASGDLSDLTVDPTPTDPHGAEVKGVLGASNDGSYVYFAANGDLDGAGPATAGNCQGTGEEVFLSFSGSCSLYAWHDGITTLVARLSGDAGAGNWEPSKAGLEAPQNTARVSADGKTLLFNSTEIGNQGLSRYRFGDPAPVCISCNPTGGPTSAAYLRSIEPYLSVVFPPNPPPILSRNLSPDGNRVFFEADSKLVANDTNGVKDVYEWEASGTGSCASDDANGGCLYLLSTGTGADPAYFADASASGDDVFIFSRDSLVPQDKDQLLDVYDVKVDGGLASQHPLEPPSCSGDACRSAFTSPPNQQGAGTAVFSGPGNPPVKRQKPRKRHRRKHHHGRAGSKHSPAGSKRGGAK
jgi:hypothetical protein